MTSKVIYKNGLSTQAVHLRSGNSITTDAPIDNQGKGATFSPTDLCATALASCLLTIMGIKARDKELDIEGTKAEVLKVMGSGPRRISRIEIKVTMPKGDFSKKDKMLLEKAALTCPVAMSLHPDVEQVIDFVW